MGSLHTNNGMADLELEELCRNGAQLVALQHQLLQLLELPQCGGHLTQLVAVQGQSLQRACRAVTQGQQQQLEL